MILSYIALVMLICVIILLVFAFVWVHDIPYQMAKKRNHANLHAIHIACWLSLFTLHALWPFVFIWAIAQKPRLEVIVVEGGLGSGGGHGPAADANKSLDAADAATLRRAVAELQQRLEKLEGRAGGVGRCGVIELAILYCGVLWVVFKKFKLLPVNTWTMVSSFLVGAFMLLFLLVMMNMYQPITDDARFMAATTPIVSEVRGKVIEVPVQSNTPLKAGDVLFKIDPVPFQHKVTAVEAQLTLARTRFKQESDLVAQKAGNQYEVERYDAEVKRLTAELDQAKIDLEDTTVRAPADGYVTQVALRAGQMAVPLPISPVMTFVHAEDAHFIAAFRQNSMQGIDPGDEVEVSLDGIPGRVFAAKVKQIIPIMQEGQINATGTLRTLEGVHKDPGRVLIEVEFTDDMTSYKLPVGSSGTTTVYTGDAHLVKFVRMILLRVKAWEKYLFTS